MNTMIDDRIIEAIKKRMEEIKNRKSLSKEELKEKIRNSAFFKRLKETQERMNAINKEG